MGCNCVRIVPSFTQRLLPCAVAAGSDIRVLAAEIEHNPQLEVTIDVAAGRVFFEDQDFPITVPDTAREALTTGQWDPIAGLLENKDAVHQRMTALGWV